MHYLDIALLYTDTNVVSLLPVGDDDEKSYVGGCDDTLAWCREGSYFSHTVTADSLSASSVSAAVIEEEAHEFEYDLVVIGGT